MKTAPHLTGFGISLALHAGLAGLLLVSISSPAPPPPRLTLDFSILEPAKTPPAPRTATVQTPPCPNPVTPARPRRPEIPQPSRSRTITVPDPAMAPAQLLTAAPAPSAVLKPTRPIPPPRPDNRPSPGPVPSPVTKRRAGEEKRTVDPPSGAVHASVPTPAEGERKRRGYTNRHLGRIQTAIQDNILYPRLARKMGWQGRVLVCFVIREDGGVEKLQVVESSGFKALDRNALEAVRRSVPFPLPPVKARITVPVVFRLT